MSEFADALPSGQAFLTEVFARTGLALTITGAQATEDAVVFDLGGDTTVLRRQPELIAALTALTAQVMARAIDARHVRCVLDPDGRFAARKTLLETAARDLARTVLKTGRRAVLDGLSPAERRVVHLGLAEDARVQTRSEGDERWRLLLVERAGPEGRVRTEDSANAGSRGQKNA
jgi:spoIIIJ-associated protein